MKTIYLVLMIIFGILLVSAVKFYPILVDKSEEKVCNFQDQSGCDRSCVSDSDCKQELCANCMNKGQNFSYCVKMGDGTSCSAPACFEIGEPGSCKCVQNKCAYVQPV
jgi:hypothetical protein